MFPNAPLTDEQRNAVTGMRNMLAMVLPMPPPAVCESVEERARHPEPASLPLDVTVHVEIAPPSSKPHPLLAETGVLKAPERVPVYFYALRGDGDGDGDPADTRVVFFIHGGGNITGHPTGPEFIAFYAKLLRAVTGATNTRWVLAAPSYRLATVPENVFPAGLQDLVAAYEHVLGKGYSAADVVIGGDSAGGGHALVLTHLVIAAGTPPSCVIAVAPNALMIREDAEPLADDILDVSRYAGMTRVYLGESGVDHEHPLVAGAFLPFGPTWPRTLVLVGTRDHLLNAARELEKRLKAADRPVELVEYEGRPHGWWIMPQVFPENVQDAMERIVRFV